MPISHETTPKTFGGYSRTRSLVLKRFVIKLCCRIFGYNQTKNISGKPTAAE
jgi:hypothetical protein